MPIVIAKDLHNDETGLRHQFLEAFDSLGLSLAFDKSQAIFVKPNLTYPKYKEGVTTRKDFVASLVDSLRKINTTTRIYIGEGEGGYNSFSMNEAFINMSFYELEKEFPQVKIINLSKMPSKEVKVETQRGPYKIALPEIFFNEIDFSISCPVPKVHCMTGITLSFKNQWGCLPDVMRLQNHYMFDHLISKISDLLKFKYALLDGKWGLNNNGPMVGDPVEVNWFAASNSLGAFDMIVSEMMGIDWRRVRHLRMADQYGFIPKKEDIEIIGDPKKLQRRFKLKRNFWNYPALAAFHSKRLTQLLYFSKLSGPLHDIMYAFRKRPLEIGNK